MIIIVKTSLFLLLAALSCLVVASDVDNVNEALNNSRYQNGEIHTGSITAINIEEHEITIEGKVLELADDLKILLPNKNVTSLLALKADQQIQYWARPQDKKALPNVAPLPPLIITKIHIISGYSENAHKQ